MSSNGEQPLSSSVSKFPARCFNMLHSPQTPAIADLGTLNFDMQATDWEEGLPSLKPSSGIVPHSPGASNIAQARTHRQQGDTDRMHWRGCLDCRCITRPFASGIELARQADGIIIHYLAT
jgi:hypothetical protein